MEENRLMKTDEAAEYLGLSPGTLENYRASKLGGPPYVKLGSGRTSPVRYRKSDVDAWAESRLVSA